MSDSEWRELLATLPLEKQFVVSRARLAMKGANRKQLINLVTQYMVQSYALQDMNNRLLEFIKEEVQDEPPT